MQQLQLAGKKVIIRVDFNVPLDKDFKVTDDTRIRYALPTIEQALSAGAAVILMSHLGRPQKKKKEDGSIDREKFTLQHVVPTLSKLLDKPVLFCPETVGNLATETANNLKPGQVMLLENTRFHPQEEKGEEAFAKSLSRLADVYINDAFGTAHRAHASTTTIAHFFPPKNKGFGLLLSAELESAKKVTEHPERPLCAITGGAKVSDKILLLERMIEFVDVLIIGGGMAYTFAKAQGGKIGNSLVEEDKLDLALSLIEKAKQKGVKLLLPEDSVIADKFAPDAQTQIVDSGNIPDGWMGLDIGPKAQKAFSEAIRSSKTIVWNGPMGVFEMEAFSKGTFTIAEVVAETTQKGAFSLIGGGDSVAAINQSGLSDQVSHISTGGGAMLELLEGKELPGVAAIGE